MPLDDGHVNAWFDQWVTAFMVGDVRSAIAGKQNFGAALMLLCYTEVIGGVSTGLLGQHKKVERNFNAGLVLLDDVAASESATNGPHFYTTFPINLNGTPTTLYDVLRCGMVHEYTGKGFVSVQNQPVDTDGQLAAGENGVKWVGGVLRFNVNAYFRQFQAAARALHSRILADTASTGARANYEKAIANLNGKKISP